MTSPRRFWIAPVRLCAAALLALAPAGLGLGSGRADRPAQCAGRRKRRAHAPAKPGQARARTARARRRKDGKDPPAPALTADEIVAKANAYFDDARVMTADFVQIGPDGGRSEGQLYVARPGKLLFKFNPPERLEIVADGRTVAVRDQKLGTQDLYFIAQTPLKFLLADHIDLAKDTSVKRVDIDENAATIEIEDKATFGGKSDISLVFDPTTFALKQWTVIDPRGFQTVVSLFDIDLVTKPDPDSVPHRRHREFGRGELEIIERRGAAPAGARDLVLQFSISVGKSPPALGDRRRAAEVARPFETSEPARAFFDRDLEHQFGAPAHRSRRTFPQGAGARRALPAGDQMPRRAIFPAARFTNSATSTSRSAGRRATTASRSSRAIPSSARAAAISAPRAIAATSRHARRQEQGGGARNP